MFESARVGGYQNLQITAIGGGGERETAYYNTAGFAAGPKLNQPQGKYTLTSVTALADPEGPPTLVCSTRELSCKETTRGSGRTDAMSRSQRHANGGGKGNADVSKVRPTEL